MKTAEVEVKKEPKAVPTMVEPAKALRERWGLADVKIEEKKPDEPEKLLEDALPAAEVVPEKPPQRRVRKPVAPPRDESGKFVPQVSAKEIAEIADAVVKANAPKPVAAANPADSLTPQQKKKLTIIKRMEELNPAAKGKAEAFTNAALKLANYQKDWEKTNKGKTFDIQDGEHEEFLKDNDVQIDPDEYQEAMADLRAEEKVRPFQEKAKAEEAEKARVLRVNTLMPDIIKRQREAGKSFISELGDDFKGLFDENNNIIVAERDKLLQRKVYAQALQTAANVETVAAELMAIATDLVRFDAKNPLHVEIFQLVERQEQAIKKLPADQQTDGGRQFATSAEWSQMSESERQRHWHLTDAELAALYADEMALSVKKAIADEDAEFDRQARQRGLIKGEPAPIPAAPVTQPAPARPQQRAVERPARSPVGSAAPRVAPVPSLTDMQKVPLIKRWTS